jgi:hypothetical protein
MNKYFILIISWTCMISTFLVAWIATGTIEKFGLSLVSIALFKSAHDILERFKNGI